MKIMNLLAFLKAITPFVALVFLNSNAYSQKDTLKSSLAKIYPLNKFNNHIVEALYLTGERIGTLNLQYYKLRNPYPIDSYELSNKNGIVYQKYNHPNTLFSNFDKNGILESKLKFDIGKKEYYDTEYYKNGTLFKRTTGSIRDDFPNGHLSYVMSPDTNRPLFFYLSLSSVNDTTIYYYPNGNPLKKFYSDKRIYYLEDGTLDTTTFDIPKHYDKQFIEAKKSGTFITYAKTGNFKEIEQYKKNEKDGIRKVWNSENGVLLISENYEKGRKVGKYEYRYLNGKVQKIGSFDNIEPKISYYESGKVETIKSALITQFDENGNIVVEGLNYMNSMPDINYNQFVDTSIVYEGITKNGLRTGLWTAKNGITGRILYKGDFKDGLEIGAWEFSLLEHGHERKIEMNFNEQHQPDGAYNHSYKGKLALTGSYKNGKKVGLWKNYYNGAPIHFYQFSKDSLPRGTIKQWDRNGKLKEENFLLNDTLYQLIYTEDGTLSDKNYRPTTDSNFIYENHRIQYGKKIMVKTIKLSKPDKYLVCVYDENRTLLSKYEKSKKYNLDGSYTTYYENGNTKEEGEYLKGERTGTFNYYNENGALIEKKEFINGKQFIAPKENEICYCVDTLTGNNGGFTPSLGNLIQPKEAVGHSRLFKIDTSLFNSKLFYRGNAIGTNSMTILAYEDVLLKTSNKIFVNLTGCRKGRNPANFYFDYLYLPYTGFLAKPRRQANFRSTFVKIKIPENALYNEKTDNKSLTEILLKDVSIKYKNNNGKPEEYLSITSAEICPDSVYLYTTKLKLKLNNKITIENKNKVSLKRYIDGLIRFEGHFTFKTNTEIQGNITFSFTENKINGVIDLNNNILDTNNLMDELKSNKLSPKFAKKTETYIKYRNLNSSESKILLTTINGTLNLAAEAASDTTLKSQIIKQLVEVTSYLKIYGFRSRKRYYNLKDGTIKKRKVVDYSTILFKKRF